jgi:hypothetical protein
MKSIRRNPEHWVSLCIAVIVSVCAASCAPAISNSALSNPEVKAAVDAAARERQQSEAQWNQMRKAFAEAALMDAFMMQQSKSVDDTKAWSLVADTHREWAGDSLDEFATNLQNYCVPSVTTAFDDAGSNMISIGKQLISSPDPKRAALSPGLIKYGSDLANLKTVCEQLAQQNKEVQEAQASAMTLPASSTQAPSDEHPYLKAAGEVVGLTLATALVGGLLVLDYAAARRAAADQTVVVSPTHCTSYQTGNFVNTNCN